MKCTDHSLHCHDIQVFYDTLMESCISACEANIPYTFTFIYVIVKERHETIMGYKPRERVALEWFIPIIVELLVL